MTQILKKTKPVSVNTDTSSLNLKDTESPFLKNYDIGTGKGEDSNEGGNFSVGKKLSSNFKTIPISLPETGFNKTIGSAEADVLNEAYVANWNSEGFHCIYRLDGTTLKSELVYQGKDLGFSIDPKHAIPEHRWVFKLVYDVDDAGNRKVKAKYIILTDGKNWQKWIDVIASTATNSFDPSAFPYYKLQTPHYDSAELIDYVVRPPIYAPEIIPVTPTAEDQSKENYFLKKTTQFSFRYIMTDGRPTALSWYSSIYYNQETNCDINGDNLPRCLDLSLYAGSANVEKIQIFVRNCDSDWALYDTIFKFKTDSNNAKGIIGDSFWLRVNPWQDFNYDSADNTIKYRYCGDKGTTIFSTEDALMVQNDVPIASVAVSNAGNALLWGHNLRFYPNFPKTTLDNIQPSVIDSGSADNCDLKTVKVTLYAFIGGNGEFGQVVSKTSPTDLNRYFGGLRTSGGFNIKGIVLNQNDINDLHLDMGTNDGFICYLAGTNYYAVGKQYTVDAAGNKTLVGIVDSSDQTQIDSILKLYREGGYYMQQFEFNVPAAQYVARLARHDSKLTGDYQSTSTFVMGIADRTRVNIHSGDKYVYDPSALFTQLKEIRVDATGGDYDAWIDKQMFYIYVPYNMEGTSWRWVEGYFQEDATTKIPVEMATYYPQLGDNSSKRSGFITDHNGFFFAYSHGGRGYKSDVYFDLVSQCSPQAGALQTKIPNADSGYHMINVYLDDINGGVPGFGNYILLTGRLVSCATGNGISGIGVTLTASRTYYTDADGYYTVRAHDVQYGSRQDTLYFNSSGDCLFNDCNCQPIGNLKFDTRTMPCETKIERKYPVFDDLKLKVITVQGNTIKGGGRYPVGVIGHDFGGRKVSVNLIGYVDVPTLIEKKAFTPSQIEIAISGKLNLPPYIKWLTFVVGKNVNFNDYIQWVGDKIEFIDSKGNLVPDGNGAIRARITIQSLLDFNTQYNFATNASYQFLQGDMLRIYDDGKGNILDPAKNGGFLDFQVLGTDFDETVVTPTGTNATPDPKTFYIEYDKRLLTLKDSCGFWIELKRVNNVLPNQAYFGVPGTYPVIDGEIKPKSIILNYFDTYFLKRSITIAGCGGASFTHPFESASVSDFWGKGCTNAGIELFEDPLAEQKWYENDCIKSDDSINEGRVNGLGICRDKNRKEFEDQNWGGIVAMHAERNIIAFICKNDWFVTDYNMNFARVDSTGRIVANLDTNLGTPNQKTGDNFGCEYEDTATIGFHDGLIWWADRKNSAVILNNYEKAYDISDVDNKGYFTNKFKFLSVFNSLLAADDFENIIDVVMGINPMNKALHITFRPRAGMSQSIDKFINNEREIFYDLPETFIYNIEEKKWTTWAAYCPEFYGKLRHSISGTEMITFVSGQSWFHNSKQTEGNNRFYNVDTDQVIEVIENVDTSKLKVYQSVAIEGTDVKYFIDRIFTDSPMAFSYIPLAFFVKRGNVWYAEILRDMNTYPNQSNPVVSMLQDGKSMTGNYAKFRIVSDPLSSDKYSEVNNVLVRLIGSEKSEK